MALPCGITGFWRVGEQPPPATDINTFCRHCYEAARKLGGHVLSIEKPNHRSFAVGTLAFPADQVAVLLNAQYPIIGFAEPAMSGELSLRFRDSAVLAEVFHELRVYAVLSASELERRPTSGDFGALSEAELAQVAYWRPQRVGDVIFNYWD